MACLKNSYGSIRFFHTCYNAFSNDRPAKSASKGADRLVSTGRRSMRTLTAPRRAQENFDEADTSCRGEPRGGPCGRGGGRRHAQNAEPGRDAVGPLAAIAEGHAGL